MVSVAVNFNPFGFEELRQAMNKAPGIVSREIEATLDVTGTIMLGQAKSNLERDGLVASGKLFRSLYVRVTPRRRTITSNQRHAAAMEKGVSPTEVVISGDFDRWMAIRGIPPSAKYPIIRSIRRKGLVARPFLAPVVSQTKVQIDREFEIMGRRIAQEISRSTRSRRRR